MKKILLGLFLVLLVLLTTQYERIKNIYHVQTLFDADKIVHNFSNMDAVMYHKKLPRSQGTHHWSVAQSISLPKTYLWQGDEKSVRAWLDTTDTTSLLIVKDGKIIFEEYLKGTSENDKRISWSMAKSYLSALFGIAVNEGLIDLNKTVTDYLPEFQNTAYNKVPIIDVLNMASGVEFDEDYLKFSSDINKMGRVLALGGSMDEFAQTLEVRAREPGTNRYYVSIDTHVLAMILRKVTGKDLHTYFQTELWNKLGSEQDVYYLTDGHGVAFALGGLNMTTRDYARFGQLFLQKGKWQGEQIVPAKWVEQSTVDTAPTPLKSSSFGYGYQWWVPQASAEKGFHDFTAGGIYGQFIYVNPKYNVVIVKTSAHRGFRDDGQQGDLIKAETMEMFRSIAASLKLITER